MSHLDECATDFIENRLVDLGDHAITNNVSVIDLLGGGSIESPDDVYNLLGGLGYLDMDMAENFTNCV